MNDKEHNLNSTDARTALTTVYLGWIFYELFVGLGFDRAFIWLFKMLKYAFYGYCVLWVIAQIYHEVKTWPSWIHYITAAIILVVLLGIILRKVYNIYIALRNKWKVRIDAKKFEIENKRKLANAIEFLQPWLHNLEFHYYNFEKEKFVKYLFDCNNLIRFHEEWDDAYRLQKMGEVTGKAYVCHISSAPKAWSREAREAAWQQKRREQSERDLKRNAELKAARKSLIKK